MGYFDILSPLLCEYFCKLVDVSCGIRQGSQIKSDNNTCIDFNKNSFICPPPASAAFLVFFPVVSLHVELPHVLIVSRPLEDGQPRVINPTLAPLRSLQDVLAVQLWGHVSRLGSSWQWSHKLLHINLGLASMSEETIIVLDPSHLSRDREPGVWTGEV